MTQATSIENYNTPNCQGHLNENDVYKIHRSVWTMIQDAYGQLWILLSHGKYFYLDSIAYIFWWFYCKRWVVIIFKKIGFCTLKSHIVKKDAGTNIVEKSLSCTPENSVNKRFLCKFFFNCRFTQVPLHLKNMWFVKTLWP